MRLVEPQRAGNRGEAQAIRLNPARSVWGPILFCHPPPVVSLCIRAIDSLWGPGAANRAPLQSIFGCSSDGPGKALPLSSQQFEEVMGEKVDVGIANGSSVPKVMPARYG